MNIGLVSPGQMGVKIAAQLIKNNHEVYWASAGRSDKTVKRAESAGLKDLNNLKDLVKHCPVLISITSPEFAEEIASVVLEASFQGLYADFNPLSPQRKKSLAEKLQQQGVDFVEGGIIGSAKEQTPVNLYLCGSKSQVIADLFSSSLINTITISDEIGQASALKLCYSTQKAQTALQINALAAAFENNVFEYFLQSFTSSGMSGDDVENFYSNKVKNAWRFINEMEEIAEFYSDSGLYGDSYESIARIYEKLKHFKDNDSLITFEQIFAALKNDNDNDNDESDYTKN